MPSFAEKVEPEKNFDRIRTETLENGCNRYKRKKHEKQKYGFKFLFFIKQIFYEWY